MTDIKKCPFCGGDAQYESKLEVQPVMDEEGYYIDADTYYWERTGCPVCDIWFFSDSDDEPEEITIARWNKRPENHTIKMLIGRLCRNIQRNTEQQDGR